MGLALRSSISCGNEAVATPGAVQGTRGRLGCSVDPFPWRGGEEGLLGSGKEGTGTRGGAEVAGWHLPALDPLQQVERAAQLLNCFGLMSIF